MRLQGHDPPQRRQRGALWRRWCEGGGPRPGDADRRRPAAGVHALAAAAPRRRDGLRATLLPPRAGHARGAGTRAAPAPDPTTPG